MNFMSIFRQLFNSFRTILKSNLLGNLKKTYFWRGLKKKGILYYLQKRLILFTDPSNIEQLFLQYILTIYSLFIKIEKKSKE